MSKLELAYQVEKEREKLQYHHRNLNLPKPRPEYVTDTGYVEFEVGDVVKLREPLPEAVQDRGVVVIIQDDWHVVWRTGEIESFDDIAGDTLIVL